MCSEAGSKAHARARTYTHTHTFSHTYTNHYHTHTNTPKHSHIRTHIAINKNTKKYPDICTCVIARTLQQEGLNSKDTIQSAYIGLTYRGKEGSFVWVDGTPLSYTNWKNDQSNDKDGTQDVAMMYGPLWTMFGSWAGCTNSTIAQTLICEKKHRTVPGNVILSV